MNAKNIAVSHNMKAACTLFSFQTVIMPSLLWGPLPQTPSTSTPASTTSGYASSGSFVNDAINQSKVIELLIKNAYVSYNLRGVYENLLYYFILGNF